MLPRPDLVLYDAGVDPHLEDRLGKLALTDTGLYDRDHMVLSTMYLLSFELVHNQCRCYLCAPSTACPLQP